MGRAGCHTRCALLPLGLRVPVAPASTRLSMTRKLVLPILALLLLAAAPAHAAEQKMTLYSNAIDVTPYSGEQHYMPLPANGEHAPAEPGWITSIKVDVVKKRSREREGALDPGRDDPSHRPARARREVGQPRRQLRRPVLRDGRGEPGDAEDRRLRHREHDRRRQGARLAPHAHADEPPRLPVQGLRAHADHLQRHAEDRGHAAMARHGRLQPRSGLTRCPATGRRARTTWTTSIYTVPDGRADHRRARATCTAAASTRRSRTPRAATAG